MKKISLKNVKKLSKMEMKKIMAGSSGGCTGYCGGGACIVFGGSCTCTTTGKAC